MIHELQFESRIIASLKPIVSKDEARYVLTGINLRCLDGKATFTASNGRALASIQAPIDIPEDLNVILPARVPHKLHSIQIDTEAKKVTYIEPGIETTVSLIDGVYPNFLKAIPEKEDEPKVAAFGIHHLEEIMASAKVYARKSKLTDDSGLYCLPQGEGPAIFGLGGHPEWFAMLMPRKVDPTIPNWLKKK